MFIGTEDDAIIDDYIYRLNDLIGPAAFAFGLTSLQFAQPSGIAFLSLCVVTVWASARAVAYKKLVEKEHRIKVHSYVYLCRLFKGANFFLGLTFLLLVSFGVITIDRINELMKW
jgi:hypothetical protein